MTDKFIPAEVFPAADYISEEIEARGWSKSEFAEIIDRSPKFVSDLLAGRINITLDTARRLGSAFDNNPQFWINLDTTYRLHTAPVGKEEDLISKRAKLYSAAPVSEMVKRGWVADEKHDVDSMSAEVLRFLKKTSFDQPDSLRLVARKGTDYSRTTPEQTAWLCRAVELAEALNASPFSPETAKDDILEIRQFSANAEDIRHVPRFLSDIGIRIVVVEHLPRTRIDGACFWLDDSSPVVALSLRYGRIDSFWYTLGHELGHIFHQHGKLPIDDNLVNSGATSNCKPVEEMEADGFARNLLIPNDKMESFIARKKPLFTLKAISLFARSIGVHPGVVLGQLQFRGLVKYAHCRPLLTDVRQTVIDATLHDGWGDVPTLERIK